MKKTMTVLLILLLVSCKSIGPKEISLDRSRYNDIIADTQDEQLLKNIIRMRYLHPISILEITNVITSYTLNPSLLSSWSAVKTPVRVTPNSPQFITPSGGLGSINPGVSYSDQPTITYMPVEDSAFIRRMLIPLEVYFINMLASGGMHDPHLIFNLTIKHLNDMHADNGTRDLAILSQPHNRRFYHLTVLLDKLSVKRGVRLIPVTVDGHETFAIHFPHPFDHSPEAKAIKKLLHIPQQYQDIVLFYKKLPIPNMAVLYTRSILGTMFFISNGIHAPDEHIRKGIVRAYYDTHHHRYHWNPLMNDIFQAYVSATYPTDAYLAVYIYNYWFYIKRGDMRSIATFTYLRTLHGLSGKAELQDLGYK
ncbi:MAG: hypothetical protein NTW08_07430 [Gammaproteobacteria bacterium]|nr:hypothetical protein [Gammaproteobacteria bacterium]